MDWGCLLYTSPSRSLSAWARKRLMLFYSQTSFWSLKLPRLLRVARLLTPISPNYQSLLSEEACGASLPYTMYNRAVLGCISLTLPSNCQIEQCLYFWVEEILSIPLLRRMSHVYDHLARIYAICCPSMSTYVVTGPINSTENRDETGSRGHHLIGMKIVCFACPLLTQVGRSCRMDVCTASIWSIVTRSLAQVSAAWKFSAKT